MPRIIGNHIEKMDRQYPLTSKFQLNILLKEWLKTSGITIGEMKGKQSNPEPWLWISINNHLFYINADTKRLGIKEYLKNEEEKYPWLIIPTEILGNQTKITNDKNGKPISHFYMYRFL